MKLSFPHDRLPGEEIFFYIVLLDPALLAYRHVGKAGLAGHLPARVPIRKITLRI
jgi:hypothetical protein